MIVVRPFECDYAVEEVHESSHMDNGLQRFYFPGASTVGGRDGVLLKVTPAAGTAWIGCFAFGLFGGESITQVSTCPNPAELCVVSSGKGYFVPADDPLRWQLNRATPVAAVRAIQHKRLLVFADYTKLVAYGSDGFVWESARVSSDGIQIVDVTGDRLDVIGWDASVSQRVRMSIDIDDGAIRACHPISD
jgi:hypothetical protein